MREGGLLGWCTNALVKLDDEVPGVLSRVLTSSSPRRQAIFSALANREETVDLPVGGDALIPTSLAEVVRHGRAADILRFAYGNVPEGLPGLLERVGEVPLPRARDYVALHDLAASADRRGVDALRGSGRVTCRKLDVLTHLDPRWHHANTLGRIDTGAEAMTFNAAVGFVQSVNSRATDEAIAGAIALMRPTSSLPKLLDRFLRRADRLPSHPVPLGDNELRPLATIRDVLEGGRRYRNCLAYRLADVAAGKMAVAEFRSDCLVEFRGLTCGLGWMLRDVHVARNAPVPLSLIAEVEAKCDALGIPRLHDAGGDDGGWRGYRRFTQELEWS